jgi:uncharacterized circularly permuted ATP-grasp superfamily protein
VAAGRSHQSPSGAGYALENREILEQVHPEPIADMSVRRVRSFLGGLRAALLNVAADEAPLAVILTAGPYNETYFEHAYLARQLGMPLVEGSDLTVRGDTVFLKTLGGLRRVHSILRRLDDDFCDPLELRSDSALGVPGLLGALRAGRVMLGNALGTGVLESAAWLGFLPPIAERLFGEKLLLPKSPPGGWVKNPPSNTCWRTSTAWSSSLPTRTSASSQCSAARYRGRSVTRSSRVCATVPMPTWRRSTCSCRVRRCGNPPRPPNSPRGR